jgi:hypothetical protein
MDDGHGAGIVEPNSIGFRVKSTPILALEITGSEGPRMKRKSKRIGTSKLSPKRVQQFVENVLGSDFYATRVRSVSDATLGVLNAGALGVHAIGHGLAVARALADKHAIKQVDRLLSNQGLSLDAVLAQWVPITPLLWSTVPKADLKGNRNAFEDQLLVRL